ncbi:MAG TPA: hypothetical protein VG013_35490 [Gemmataceae bacterium]|jgi:hypothetical protein|nr:hypothetical protein [Gemmataceae bacterium]
MKYFTPDLLARFGSTDDGIADLANEEWERAHAAYLAHLKEMRPRLPRSVRSLLRHFSLHDARVLMIGYREAGRVFSICMQLDSARQMGVQLIYRLAGEPEFIHHTSLSGEGAPLEWLYDEIEIASEGPYAVMRHSILFTGGREFRLVFHELKWVRYQKMVAPTAGGLEGGAEGALESLLT